MSSGPNHDRPKRRPKVLSEDWEVALRAGQEAEGLAGSVEPELAIVHLLRHARAPEGLDDARLDAVWSDVDAAIAADAPVPWWRRPWTWIGGTAFAAAAAAAVLVIVIPRGPEGATPGTQGAGEGGGTPVATGERSQAEALERQFQILAPKARARVAAVVDDGRGQLRDQLLARAIADDTGRSQGGAP